MKRKQGTFLLAAALIAGLMTGCGSSNTTPEMNAESYVTNDIYTDAAYTKSVSDAGETYAMEATAEEKSGETASGSSEVEVQDTRRKLIRNVDLEVETEEFDELIGTVTQKTEQAGGYIEQSYTYNGSNYYGRESRNANLTLRVPADQLDVFLSSIAEVSNVISRNESVSDVTLQYVDMESHKKALETEQDRLLELLEQAETVEDIISIESRLSEVRYQIESMESQLRTMDNQVTYSTVYLYINEVTTYTPVAQQSIGERIITGISRSISDIGNGFVDLMIWLIIKLPYLILWAGVILVIVLIVRAGIKKNRKKKVAADRTAEEAQKSEEKDNMRK